MGTAGFLGGIILVLALVFLSEKRRRLRLRRMHTEERSGVPDESFRRLVGVSASDAAIACQVRAVIAREMGVPAETLLPSDAIAYIASFGFDGMDHLNFEIPLEKALSIKIPKPAWNAFWRQNDHATIGQLIHFILQETQRHTIA